jgi:hypothetical protein
MYGIFKSVPCILILGALYYISAGKPINHTRVHCEPVVTAKIRKKIQIAAAQAAQQSGLSVALLEQIKSAAPCIKNIVLDTYKPSLLNGYITMLQPLARLNEQYALLENGTIVPVNMYLPRHTTTAPSLQCPKELIAQKKSCQDLVTFAANVSAHMLENYTIAWHDNTEIHLIDKKNPQFCIVADMNTYTNQELFRRCVRIQENLIQQPSRKRICWSADIRFKDQIIVATHKGGRDYEKTICS